MRSHLATPKLAVPVRKWARTGGGFCAAFTADVPMNDRMSWIVVGQDGSIMATGRSLADLPAEFATGSPDLIFGGGSSGSNSVPSDPGPVQPPAEGGSGKDPAPLHPPPLVQRLAALALAHADSPLRDAIVGQFGSADLRARDYAKFADIVAAFHIGETQAQAPEWHSIVADLRALAASMGGGA
jgi:hypothetical protein